MNNNQIATIDITQLEHVTGGGKIGSLVKLAQKAGPKIADGAKWVGGKAKDAAIWTGIPAAIGGGAAWVKDKFDGK